MSSTNMLSSSSSSTNLLSSSSTNPLPSASSNKIPFEASLLSDFVSLVTTLFYDDGAAVILELLCTDQRAYTEADIREKLRWNETLVNSKLNLLEKHQLVVRERNQPGGEGGAVGSKVVSKVVAYWRVNEYLAYVIEYRVHKVMETLRDGLANANEMNEFVCVGCGRRVGSLEAAGGELSLDDEHPLCRVCGGALELSDSAAVKQEAVCMLRRGQEQLADLIHILQRVKTMEIPVFPCYTRATKKEESRQRLEEQQHHQFISQQLNNGNG